jgi:hypothetical protein
MRAGCVHALATVGVNRPIGLLHVNDKAQPVALKAECDGRAGLLVIGLHIGMVW